MAGNNFLGRLRSVAKNAVVWGAAWFGLTVVTFTGLRMVGVLSFRRLWLLDTIGIGVKAAVIGGIAGTAFSVFISLFYRGRRLSDISWLRFGIGGGILAGLFVPGFLVAANLLSGGGLPAWSNFYDDAVMSALFGGVTAGASMWLAQRGERGAIGNPDSHDRIGEGAASVDTTAKTEEPTRVRNTGK